MTVTFSPIVLGLEFALYDGTNGAELIAELVGSTFTSDVAGVLTFDDHQPLEQQYTAPWYIFRTADGLFGGAGATPDGYLKLAEIVQRYAADGVELVQSVGTASVPASLLGNSGADYDVTISPAQPSAEFVPIAQLRGAPTILYGHSILSATVIDADTVRVRVQSAAASLAGASILVTAHGLAATP